ncbi:aldo/keto reductase, partial [Streptomyces scopuliridis]|uniref:aldo/keto reductase n=1 Tax=Streptomyces scopuliridis TaxID=452529 RepID=UPI0019D1F5AF
RQARPARVEGGAGRGRRGASAGSRPAHYSQVALAWPLARSPAVMPIPGTTGIAHLRENVDAQDLELSPEDIRSTTDLAPEGAEA